jgi:hypothetical protein
VEGDTPANLATSFIVWAMRGLLFDKRMWGS